MSNRAAIEKIISRAIHAPSGDNSQPWEFSVSDDTLLIRALPELDHPILNVEGRGTYIAIGALIENIVVASGEEGLAATIDLFPSPDTTARIRFAESSRSVHPLSAAIEGRHTQRSAYAVELPPDSEAALHVDGEPHCSVEIVTNAQKIARISKAVSAMEEVALRTQKLHHLFFKSILWQKEENDAGKPGLYIKTTELPAPVRGFFRIIRHWPIMSVLNKIGFAKNAAGSNASVYAKAGACAAIILEETTPSDFIRAGRVMQRLWLSLTAHGLAAQPMAGLLYVAEYLNTTHDPDIESDLHSLVADSRQVIAHEVGAGNRTIAMLLRIGAPLRPATARTARKNPVIISV